MITLTALIVIGVQAINSKFATKNNMLFEKCMLIYLYFQLMQDPSIINVSVIMSPPIHAYDQDTGINTTMQYALSKGNIQYALIKGNI